MGQGVELRFPEAPVAGDPLGRVFQGVDGETAAMNPAVPLAREQPGALEHSEMLRDCGERDAERPGQLCHRGYPARQPRQDRPAGGVRQGRKGRVQGSLIVNHKVKYNGGPAAVKRELALSGPVLVSYRPQNVGRKGGDAWSSRTLRSG